MSEYFESITNGLIFCIGSKDLGDYKEDVVNCINLIRYGNIKEKMVASLYGERFLKLANDFPDISKRSVRR